MRHPSNSPAGPPSGDAHSTNADPDEHAPSVYPVQATDQPPDPLQPSGPFPPPGAQPLYPMNSLYMNSASMDSLYSGSGLASGSAAGLPGPLPRTGEAAAGPGGWPPGRPLRVVHINAALLSAGIENWLASLAKYADPDRLRFIRCLVLGPWVEPMQVRRMGMPVTVGGGRASVVSAARDCDVMMISDPGGQAQRVARWIAEQRPRLTVFIAHGDGPFTRERILATRAVTDHVVAVSPHVRRTVVDDPTASVILNGVDPQRLVQTRPRQTNRAQLGFAETDFVVGFVGRFSEEKNPQLAIDAVAALPPHCKLLIVGCGPLREPLVERCIRSLPSRFTLIDGSGLDNLGDLYTSMDAFLMPSRLEGYGLVAMEAMMCGVPTVVTPFGFAADLIQHRINGLIVAPTAASLAAAISDLMLHRDFAKSVGQAGRATAAHHGYASAMAQRYEQLIGALWSSTPGSE